MSRVTMLLSNAYRPDPRVQREVQTLLQNGHDVSLYCWDRQGEFAKDENQDGLIIHRLLSVRSHYAAGWRQITRLPRFWLWAIDQVMQHSVEIVHCHDLDTLYAGLALKDRTGCKVVFDAHEHYPTQMSLYLPKSFVWFLTLWEKLMIRRADGIITASQTLAEAYRRKTNRSVVVVGNAPAVKMIPVIRVDDILAIRQVIDLAADQLGIFYIGGFTKNRAFEPLFEAVEGLEKWQLHIWGDGPQRQLVEAAASQLENVHYHGWAASDRLPVLFAAADAIYYCLRTDYPGAQYNAPNSLAHAMAAGRPIIANTIGDLGRLVGEHQCGIILHEINSSTIRQTLSLLEDQPTRQRLGENGRQAATSQYNWETFSQNLIDLYAGLTR